jgi:hypothetical protein
LPCKGERFRAIVESTGTLLLFFSVYQLFFYTLPCIATYFIESYAVVGCSCQVGSQLLLSFVYGSWCCTEGRRLATLNCNQVKPSEERRKTSVPLVSSCLCNCVCPVFCMSVAESTRPKLCHVIICRIAFRHRSRNWNCCIFHRCTPEYIYHYLLNRLGQTICK